MNARNILAGLILAAGSLSTEAQEWKLVWGKEFDRPGRVDEAV